MSKRCMCNIKHELTKGDDRDGKFILNKFTFVGSPFFDNGVTHRAFANSQAISICNSWGLDSSSIIEINIVKDTVDQTVNFTTVEYQAHEILNFINDYDSISEYLNQFITGVYKGDFSKCYQQTDMDIDEQDFISMLKKSKREFYPEYESTIIVGYDVDDTDYVVSGGIVDKSNNIYLFAAKIRKVDKDYKIVRLSF